MTPRQAWEAAKVQGGEARRAGRKRAENPFRGSTKEVRDRHNAWGLGWIEADTAIKAAKR